MADTACPVWRTPATLLKEFGDKRLFDSPRAGGRYVITGTAEAMVERWDPNDKVRLTLWLCDQRRLGIATPEINSFALEDAKLIKLLSTTERIEKALLYFRQFRVGQKLVTPKHEQFDTHDEHAMLLAAETASLTKAELIAFCDLLIEMDVLRDWAVESRLHQYGPTAKGWLKIEELTTRLPDTTQVFVAMWFNDSMQAAYDQGIAPAIADAGYRAVRIDKKEHSNKIDDEIIAEIRRSKFLVADFSCEPEKVRGGVYFEAGFAMGLGIPVIWTVSKGSFHDMHFDTRQYNHIVWDTPQSLRSQLRTRIGAVIGDGPLLS